MKSTNGSLTLLVASLALTACTQTSLLKPESGNTASAIVESLPVLFGTARFAVSLDEKTFTGAAGELHEDTTGDQAGRFGWDPSHKHPHIKQEMKFLYGSTTLTAVDGDKLECDHLRHGDDWRLRCKRPGAGDIQLRRVRQ
ncbi:MAG: hypothetical protein HY661_10285 [Betaproteobacteria bacterium]|nr:hypothetical protein [Betaproteobacteria bacterium]